MKKKASHLYLRGSGCSSLPTTFATPSSSSLKSALGGALLLLSFSGPGCGLISVICRSRKRVCVGLVEQAVLNTNAREHACNTPNTTQLSCSSTRCSSTEGTTRNRCPIRSTLRRQGPREVPRTACDHVVSRSRVCARTEGMPIYVLYMNWSARGTHFRKKEQKAQHIT